MKAILTAAVILLRYYSDAILLRDLLQNVYCPEIDAYSDSSCFIRFYSQRLSEVQSRVVNWSLRVMYSISDAGEQFMSATLHAYFLSRQELYKCRNYERVGESNNDNLFFSRNIKLCLNLKKTLICAQNCGSLFTPWLPLLSNAFHFAVGLIL